MKKIIIVVFIVLIIIPIFLKKEKEITPQVISYIDEIDKINETCHINTNKLNIDLRVEYLNTLKDKKIILYGNGIDELNNYLKKEYFLENKKFNLTINNEGYVYEIFSVFISKPDDYNHTQLLFKDNEYERHIDYLINETIYEKEFIPRDSFIITIQKQYDLNKYLIINARRI